MSMEQALTNLLRAYLELSGGSLDWWDEDAPDVVKDARMLLTKTVRL
jgi:hypothetical protein